MKKGLLKKLFATILVGAMAISMVACGGEDAEKKDMLTQIKESGKFTVGMSIDYAPYEFFVMENGEKKQVGMDVDLIAEIAKDMGVTYEIKEMDFDTICESVANGVINMGVSGLSPEPERMELVDFSDIYFEAEQGILISKKNADKIKSIDDLKGMKVGAQTGSIQASIANEIEGAKVTLLKDVPTLVQTLKRGDLDALIVELPVADIQAIVNDDLAVAEEKIQDNSGGGSAVGLPKEQYALKEQINKTIKRLKDEGKIQEFYENGVKLSKNEVVE